MFYKEHLIHKQALEGSNYIYLEFGLAQFCLNYSIRKYFKIVANTGYFRF